MGSPQIARFFLSRTFGSSFPSFIMLVVPVSWLLLVSSFSPARIRPDLHPPTANDDVDNDKQDVVESPGMLALLSFSLLLRLLSNGGGANIDMEEAEGSKSIAQRLDRQATEGTRYANDKCGAFAYLHSTMSSLLPPPHSSSMTATTDPPPPMAATNEAVTVAYVSVGREILTSTISAYQSRILSLLHPTAPQNVGMLCNLAAVIYRNGRVLCERFWRDRDAYCARAAAGGNSKDGQDNPLCHLLEAVHFLASSAAPRSNEALRQGGPVDASLVWSSLAPLLCLISLLCYDLNLAFLIATAFMPSGSIRMSDVSLGSEGENSLPLSVLPSSLGEDKEAHHRHRCHRHHLIGTVQGCCTSLHRDPWTFASYGHLQTKECRNRPWLLILLASQCPDENQSKLGSRDGTIGPPGSLFSIPLSPVRCKNRAYDATARIATRMQQCRCSSFLE